VRIKSNKVEQAILLSGGYIAIQMMADISATKLIIVGPIVVDAGIIYALTFTWRDLIHKRLGARAARIAIVLAGIINLFMAGYFYIVAKLPPETEWALTGGQTAWEFVFGLVPRVVIASILAEVVSELVDTEIYSAWVRKLENWPQWTRVAASNFISIPLDTALFVAIAFGGLLPMEVLISGFIGNIILKVFFTITTFWTIYLVKEDRKLA
jgi:queuosine precursor transporter